MPDRDIRTRQLALDRQHGASFLLRQALLILKDEASELPSANREDYLRQLQALARGLQHVRPSMAAIKNGLEEFIAGIAALQFSNPPADPVESVTTLVDAILTGLDEKFALAAANGAALLKDGQGLLSCSFSATVCAAILQARADGKSCPVLIVEAPRELSPLPYGEMMAEALCSGGIECRLLSLAELRSRIKGVDLAMVGADSVFADGAVINGYPSLDMARACRENNLPFYCLCESHKLTADAPLPLEEGFDLIPARLVTAVITEKTQFTAR